MVTAARARETAARARAGGGGGRRLLEHDAARFFADTEAVYSYEGTHEMNALIVGRSLTGLSAFA
jgi:glutaryl-CoA dehydrogenase